MTEPLDLDALEAALEPHYAENELQPPPEETALGTQLRRALAELRARREEVKALRELLVAYRLGRQPAEWALNALDELPPEGRA